jgi:hypothetical protein
MPQRATAAAPRKFGQVPQLTVPDTFDEPLTDAQIGPGNFVRGQPTSESRNRTTLFDL